MSLPNSIYSPSYFATEYFQTDYKTIAKTIVELYHPKTVADFGCGPGYLSRELAKLGIQVTAVDGFTQPDFAGLSVEFHPCDLDQGDAIRAIFQHKTFDLAICLEVAEHLKPDSSPMLLDWLTQLAPVVLLSAAVLGQPGGPGHINLRPREFWHQGFVQRGFLVADRIREKLRQHPDVAIWYRLNAIDYVHHTHPQAPNPDEVIARLIASESASTTAYFEEFTKLAEAKGRLNSKLVRWALVVQKFKNKIVNRLLCR